MKKYYRIPGDALPAPLSIIMVFVEWHNVAFAEVGFYSDGAWYGIVMHDRVYKIEGAYAWCNLPKLPKFRMPK